MAQANESNSVDMKITAAKQEILEEVRSQIESALADNERNIIKNISDVVANAVAANNRVVVANLPASTSAKGESRGFEIFKTVLPVLLTVGLGFWIFILQKGLEGKLEEQKQDLTARLALTQQYQKRKVETYEMCAKDMSSLLEGLEMLRIDRARQKQAADSVHALYEDARNNSLYISEGTAQRLSDVRSDAITSLQSPPSGSLNIGTVENDITSAEKQMKQELLAATAPLSPAR